MSFVPTLDTDSPQRPRIPRSLDPAEVRVLGSLMEKQLSTPEYYPLTLNALVAACNQKSNREPVMEMSEDEVQRALDRLQDEKLVWKVMGGRAVRYDHALDQNLQLDRAAKAALALLFLRGPQTPGELRGRSDRLYAFEGIVEVEETLRRLAPLVTELPRRPGQKEARWSHTLAGVEAGFSPPEQPAQTGPHTAGPHTDRLTRLEEQVASLTAELHALKAKLGE
jgi:uncharacterized protein